MTEVPNPSTRTPRLLLEAPAAYADDLKWRFLTCAALTWPVAYLAEPVQQALGLGVDKRLAYTSEIVLGLAAAIVLYGAWPFVAGAVREARRARPGTSLLSVLALGTFGALLAAGWNGPDRMPRTWEVIGLVDALLLGHWIAVAGAARAGTEEPPAAPRTGRRLVRAADFLAATGVAGAVAALVWWITADAGHEFAAMRAVAVLVSTAPLALVATGRLAGRRGPGVADLPHGSVFDVTHILVPDGGTEEQVLARAAVAEGDEPVLHATRRAALARGMHLNGDVAHDGSTQLLSTPDVRAAGIDAPLDAVAELNGAASVVWVVERRRVAGALALAASTSASANGDVVPPDLRRTRQNLVLVVLAQLLALPIAGGALAPIGFVPPAAACAILAGALTALVAWNGRR